jgi:23S rRNA pseudouridine1911/1915/1917 synthase
MLLTVGLLFWAFHRPEMVRSRIRSNLLLEGTVPSRYRCDNITAGSRLDTFLVSQQENIPRNVIGALCERGKVMVNGDKKKKSYRVQEGDKVEVIYSAEAVNPSLGGLKLDVIYEDNDMLAINKPSGLVVHPAGTLSQRHTFLHLLMNYLGMKFDTDVNVHRNLLVHRLDKDTTGVLLAGKSIATAASLRALFEARSIRKHYVAIVIGDPDSGTLDHPLMRSKHNKMKVVIDTMGSGETRSARTHVKTIFRSQRFSLVALRLETGRTHQIRVHLQHRGTPVLGDKTYRCGDKLFSEERFPMPLLHAVTVAFDNPFRNTSSVISIAAPLHPYFSTHLKSIFGINADDELKNIIKNDPFFTE